MTRADPSREAAAEPLILRCRVPTWAHGTTLLAFLARRFRYHSEPQWRRELTAGRVAIDGVVADGAAPLRRGQVVAYTSPHPEPDVDLDVPVLHADDHVLVVAKPAGLPCHGDGAFVRHTVVHQLGLRYGRVHLVHRLDRETSGVLVAARSRAARAALEAGFRAGEVDKAYLAAVRGRVAGDFVVDAPIGRAPDSAVSLRRAVVASDAGDARPARTEFELVEPAGDRALLRCRPRTGRTHQIRVHLEHAGHPILGDKLYGRSDADYLAFVRQVKASGSARGLPRQLLHAETIGFRHPGSGRPMRFHAPLPADLGAWREAADA